MCPLFPRHSLMTLHHLHICLYMLFLPSLWLFSFIFNVVNLTYYFHSLSDGTQPWCHFSCHAIENPHHVFIHCHCFNPFCGSATSSVASSTSTLLDASTLDSASCQSIMEQLQGLFCDTDTWPAQWSLHMISIRLVVRIWGEVQRKFWDQQFTTKATPKITFSTSSVHTSLPCYHQHILP